MTETKKKTVRRTMETYWKGKKIVVQIGPGDILKFRYEKERTWMEMSIAGALQHAASLKEGAHKSAQRIASGKPFLAKRGMLS